MKRYDLAITGGGIVGLASAWRLLQRAPGRSLVLFEKESALASHQTGRNSGVIHSGIYYRPGSLRAVTCREGKRELEAFCEEHGVAHETCGKVIVAVDESELPRLERILERGRENGVACRRIDAAELRDLEPHAAGIAAIHVPEAGIVDYPGVCRALAGEIVRLGGEILTGTRVTGFQEAVDAVAIETTRGEFEARTIVNCGGLHADRLAEASGDPPPARIVPFRGEYYDLRPDAWHLCRHLIYPVPDPAFPFLGVHFTRALPEGVECGPNAVLAFAREGYRKRDVNLRDLFGALTYSGFLHLAAKHWRTGCGEMWRSFSRRAFVRALSRLVPEIRIEHLSRAPAGVRAQALTPDGQLVDDFLIRRRGRIVNVLNAPSPAATASLRIGTLIADETEAG